MIDTTFLPSYEQFFDHIITHGEKSAPRGEPVYELFNTSIEFSAGVFPHRSKLNPMIGFMEMCQLIAGKFDLDAIARVAPNARLDLFGAQSAYGPRVADQIPLLLEALNEDILTRRGYLTLIKPEEAGSPDAPCTTAFQFQALNGVLNMTATMRSSDAVWGLPYDVIQFGGLCQAVAYSIGTLPGHVKVNFANSHVYENTMHLRPLSGVSKFWLPKIDGGFSKYRAWAEIAVNQDWHDSYPPGIKVMEGMKI